MDTDTPGSKLRAFPNAASQATVRDLLDRLGAAPAGSTGSVVEANPPQKLGLYPLGGDVLVSLPLYELILATLERGSTEHRALVAEMMRAAYGAPFQP